MFFQAWGQQLGCKCPLQSPIAGFSRGSDRVSVSVTHTYQVPATLSPDFSSAWASFHFLPNPMAYQKSLSSWPVYLQQTSNILFSASKSYLTSVDSKNLALNWTGKSFRVEVQGSLTVLHLSLMTRYPNPPLSWLLPRWSQTPLEGTVTFPFMWKQGKSKTGITSPKSSVAFLVHQ